MSARPNLEVLAELNSTLTERAWDEGSIRYLLKPCQQDMLTAIEASERFKYVIKCARRLGKTFLLCVIAVSECLRKPGAQVRFAAPTKIMLRKLIKPIMAKILAECPPELRPEFVDNTYVFPHRPGFALRSEIHLAGVNNGNADALRGPATDLAIVDEAGTVDDLHYLVHDVLLPQLIDENMQVVQGRRMLIASSPPRTPAHEFTAMANEAEVDGNYSHYNIFSGGYPNEVLRMFLKEDGVKADEIERFFSGDYEHVSSTIKREYLALDVVDEESALIPEWRSEFVVEDIVKDEFFPFYFKYEALDVGVRDNTACLFAHYDFKRAELFIHDEVVMNGPQMTTRVLAEAVKAKERVVFGVPGKEKEGGVFQVKLRVSDKDLLLIQDLRADHGLPFLATDKGELEQMVNELRIWVGNRKVKVHKRCKQTIGCLAYGVWNKRRTKFDRTPAYGHFDALAALMYLVRNIKHDCTVNPIPRDFKKQPEEHWFNEDTRRTELASKMKRAFGSQTPGKGTWRRQ